MTTDVTGMRTPGGLSGVSSPGRERPRPRLTSLLWWLVFIAGVLYFFVPLYATLAFSLREQPMFSAYANVGGDSGFIASLVYSAAIGVTTIIVSIAIIVPTAYWVRLRLPRLRPVVEFVTLLPFVIPPVILVFGLIRTYSGDPLPLTNTQTGSDLLLVSAYTVLSFPYMYRAVDSGLRAIDVQSLTEASQSLGRRLDPDSVAGHLPQPAGVIAQRRVPDPGHRHRRIHDRDVPCPTGLRSVPLGAGPDQGL